MLVFEYPLRLFAKRPIYIFSSTCENIQKKILLNNNMSSPVGFEPVWILQESQYISLIRLHVYSGRIIYRMITCR